MFCRLFPRELTGQESVQQTGGRVVDVLVRGVGEVLHIIKEGLCQGDAVLLGELWSLFGLPCMPFKKYEIFA